MRLNKPNKAVKRTISMPGHLMTAAKYRASKEGRSLSNYFQKLALDDLGRTPEPLKAYRKGKVVA